MMLTSQYDVLVKWLKVHSDKVKAVSEHVNPLSSSTSLVTLGNWPVYIAIPPNYKKTIIM